MTAAFLQSELTSLISDSKRKHIDVKTAAEKSLTDLKSISVTSESQLAGDLIRRSHFIDPFILACKSKNVKIASNGAACLQRLVASIAIPRSRLSDVLQAFEEAVPLALEVQLKILQTLPSLLQLYATDLHGEALARTLSVSADLSSSKIPMVNSTAGATFQQLVTAVFSRSLLPGEAQKRREPDDSDSARDREDAIAIFLDLCSLLTGDRLNFVRLENLPPSLVLGTLETLLSTYDSIILDDEDATNACSKCLIPGVTTLIDSSSNYGIVTRALRIAFTLAQQYLTNTSGAYNDLFKVVLKIVDRAPSQKWKRVLALEYFRGLTSDFDTLRNVFTLFDLDESKLNVVSNLMASLVRTTSEDPSLIGLGRQSTIPTTKGAEGGGDVAASVDAPLASAPSAGTTFTGISSEWSTVPVPCLDILDRGNPPEIPDTYVYTIVLGCISAFSDGLSKFIMPLSMPNRKTSRIEEDEAEASDFNDPRRRGSIRAGPSTQKYQLLVNPLNNQDSNRYALVEVCAKMIDACWPAVLAICSTFLNAALDSYFYHMLIRTVQKLTQVSGVLDLNTPRDALLTTLAKVSVPANVSNLMNTIYGGKPALQPNTSHPYEEEEEPSVRPPLAENSRQSIDMSAQNLNLRNLLCLRALLNLGIALGPSLSTAAWTIIMQSLEQVEALMSNGPIARWAQPSVNSAEAGEAGSSSTLAGEVSAVDTARRRMLESTKTYPEEAFKTVCQSLLHMVEDIIPKDSPPPQPHAPGNGSVRPNASTHQSSRSVSGGWSKAVTLEIEVQFVLRTIGRLASSNLHRFREVLSSNISWELIVAPLLLLQSNSRLLPHLRLQAAKIIDAIVVETSAANINTEDDDKSSSDRFTITVHYGIPALGKQLDNIQRQLPEEIKHSEVDVKIIQTLLETLQNVIGSCGESLGDGWKGVFRIMDLVTSKSASAVSGTVKSLLYPSTFKVTQLIVSDFLGVLDDSSVAALLTLFARFTEQETDLNMSLTTSALYWNVATMVLNRTDVNVYLTTGTETSDRTEHNLWEATILSLAELCRDDRAEVRNAALGMLLKIIETSLPQMESFTFNACFRDVLLTLMQFYYDKDEAGASSWEDSIKQLLQEIVKLACDHPASLTKDQTFLQSWTKFLQKLSSLLNLHKLDLDSIIFESLSVIIASLRQAEQAEVFTREQNFLIAAWDLWSSFDLSGIVSDGSNHDAIASHSRLLIQMIEWNSNTVAKIPRATDTITEAIKASTFKARHGAYTLDVNRVSNDQEQVLHILQRVKKFLDNDKRSYVQLLLDLISDMVARTMEVAEDTNNAKIAPKSSRQPTGIAFVTVCLEKLKQILTQEASSSEFWLDVPVSNCLFVCANLAGTKYTRLPYNEKDPLWQKASLVGSQCLTVLYRNWSQHTERPDLSNLGPPIIGLMKAIFKAPDSKDAQEIQGSLKQNIADDEKFDVEQLKLIHEAAYHLFFTNSIPSQFSKEYILTLFHHSLSADPWYNDLLPDLNVHPLTNLMKIRRGSIRAPILRLRRGIYREALTCLFDLVSNRIPLSSESDSPDNIRTYAAPYILLRLAHTLKTFMADQPLRYLEPPHPILQSDIHVILGAYIDLRVIDSLFNQSAKELGCGIKSTPDNEEAATLDLGTLLLQPDGRSHLRILFAFMQRFETVWFQMPRLKKGYAWQDWPDGKGVEECLKRWKAIVSQGWGPNLV